MEVEFHGAAREVTGSCHIVRIAGRAILLDFGLFQGKRADTRAKNVTLPCSVEEIDTVILSHAHIDHSGRLPLLWAHGYRGSIWATAATRDLAAVMLADSAHIQEKDAQFLSRRGRTPVPPLYTVDDAAELGELMIGVPYHRAFDVNQNVRATFIDAGHILGSAMIILDCQEKGTAHRLVYSGDIGRPGLPIIRDPEIPDGVQSLIMESTYGNRTHTTLQASREELARIIRETAARGGRALIPAFAIGRTQELLYDLHHLYRSADIPAIPIVIDSPLAIDATSVFAMHPEVFDRKEDLVRTVEELFEFSLVRFTRTVEESKALNSALGPMVIIAASGMAETGRILHHLLHSAADPRNAILIVGFQAEHTLGRRIVEQRPVIKVFDEEVPLRASVHVLNGYSAHADRTELMTWVKAVSASSPALQRVFLVHGEQGAQNDLMLALRSPGLSVESPAPGMRYVL